jgi:hypothetical protein
MLLRKKLLNQTDWGQGFSLGVILSSNEHHWVSLSLTSQGNAESEATKKCNGKTLQPQKGGDCFCKTCHVLVSCDLHLHTLVIIVITLFLINFFLPCLSFLLSLNRLTLGLCFTRILTIPGNLPKPTTITQMMLLQDKEPRDYVLGKVGLLKGSLDSSWRMTWSRKKGQRLLDWIAWNIVWRRPALSVVLLPLIASRETAWCLTWIVRESLQVKYSSEDCSWKKRELMNGTLTKTSFLQIRSPWTSLKTTVSKVGVKLFIQTSIYHVNMSVRVERPPMLTKGTLLQFYCSFYGKVKLFHRQSELIKTLWFKSS